MEQQLGLFDSDFKKSKHVTRTEKFLAKMDSIIPWHALEELIEPYYPKAGHGGRSERLASTMV
jgi:IS5 family transposase